MSPLPNQHEIDRKDKQKQDAELHDQQLEEVAGGQFIIAGLEGARRAEEAKARLATRRE
ncbi:MAG: hypothetical protein AB7K24_34445 [Gemmataceae bacterium]